MRKNRTMRLAALLLALTLITSCFVGGTFAKYVTSGTSEDSARVAKFGVTIDMEADPMFAAEYDTDDTEYTGAVSVKSFNGEDLVVAPGTNSGNNAATFSISGTPEVATKVSITLDVTEDVFLKAATDKYTDWTAAPYDETFDLAEDYYPVVFTLKQNGVALASGNLTAIKEFVEEYAETAYYAPGTVLDAEFELSWAWAFDGDDQADTLLGNLAADKAEFGKDLVDGTDYNLDIDYTLTVTVEQVD